MKQTENQSASRDAIAGSPAPHGSASYPLFKHMFDTYQLTLIEDELHEIIAKSDESRMKASGRGNMVCWALVNALYHLDTEQLHELGEAIAKRSGGTYSPNAEVSDSAGNER